MDGRLRAVAYRVDHDIALTSIVSAPPSSIGVRSRGRPMRGTRASFSSPCAAVNGP